MPLSNVNFFNIVVGMAVLFLFRFKLAFPFGYHRSSTSQTECRKLSVPSVSSSFASFSPAIPLSEANLELQKKNFSWIILFMSTLVIFTH